MAKFRPRSITPEQAAASQAAAALAPAELTSRFDGATVGAPQSVNAGTATETAADQRVPGEVAVSSVLLPTSPIGAPQSLMGGTWTVGSVHEVPLERIRPNPVNPRAIYTAAAVEEMAQSLRQNGQRISATGYVEGEYVVLIEGQTRYRGCEAAGLQTLRVEIKERPASVRQLYEEARAVNVERHNQSPLDDALRWTDLLERGVYPDQKTLAAALKVDKGDVSRTLSLARMSSSVMQAVAEVPALHSLRMLSAISRYEELCGSDDETLRLLLEIKSRGLGYREVERRCKEFGREPVKRPRAQKQVVEFRGGRGELKTVESEGRFELCLTGLKPDDIRHLQEQMHNLLAT